MNARIIGALCLLKAVDVADRGSVALAMLWVVVGVATAVRARFAVALIVAVALTYWSGMENQHLWLFGMAGVLLVLDDDAVTRAAMRWQITILYGFAVVAKLSEDYLSGEVLTVSAGRRPLGEAVGVGDWQAAAVAGLVVEAFLAVGLWFVPWIAIPAGVVFHSGVVAFMSSDLVSMLRLIVFGGLVLAYYPAFHDRRPAGRRRRSAQAASTS